MKKILVVLVLLVLVGLMAWGFRSMTAETGVEEQAAAQAETNSVSPTTETRTESTSNNTTQSKEDRKTELSRDEFLNLSERVWEHVPNKADLQKLTEKDVHNTPDVLLQAGLELGSIAQAVKENPHLVPEAISFYERCSADQAKPDTIRALCFAHYRKLGERQNLRLDIVSPEIKNLSDKVMSL